MTAPRDRSRRIGFVPAPWQQSEDVLLLARAWFLQAVREVAPEVLWSLSSKPDTDEARRDWGAIWGLSDPWCLDLAARTQRMWREFPDLVGQWALLGRVAWVNDAAPRMGHRLVTPEHVVWLVRVQCQREKYMTIAREVAARPGAVSDGRPETARPSIAADCRRLAALLGLTLRPRRRGRPRTR